METNSRRGVHVPPGEGESLWVVGDTYTFKATTENTGGSLALWEAVVPPQAGPPPHTNGEDESFYVLEGKLEILDGERTFVAGTGSFVFVPKGTVHRFKNIGTEPAKMLIICIPSGIEKYFKEVGKPAREGEISPPPTKQEIETLIALAPKYGYEILPDHEVPEQS